MKTEKKQYHQRIWEKSIAYSTTTDIVMEVYLSFPSNNKSTQLEFPN